LRSRRSDGIWYRPITATRKSLFDRAAADRMLVTGCHFPFPACGHLVKTATGYEHVPVEWQPAL
jgi:hypothetical protein